MIELHSVSKSYDGVHSVVRNVDLHVSPGELLVLLGASGCGKTTTLKMINRLIEPTSGHVIVDGQDTRQCDPVMLRRSIGYVFQMIGLFPHLTISQNVATVPRLLRWSRARIESRVNTLLDLVGLPRREFGHRYPRELSGGQRQRVGFARGLAADPKVFLLDEPFGALDPITRDGLRREFRRIQQSLMVTAVMVTHDIMEALLIADRIAVMQAGRVVRIGTPSELMGNPGHPYVSALLETPRRQAQELEAMAWNRQELRT